MPIDSVIRGMVVKAPAPRSRVRVRTAGPAVVAPATAAKPATAHAAAPTASVLLRHIGDALAESQQPDTGLLRASAVADYCPRAEALCRIYGDPATAVATAVGNRAGERLPIHVAVTFGIGTALHEYLQNRVLGPAGLIYGRWRCDVCGAVWGGEKPPTWVPMPESLAGTIPAPTFAGVNPAGCPSPDDHRTRFVEAFATDRDLLLSGHMDGAVVLPGRTLAGLEMKSVSERQFTGLRSPLAEHVVQANIYMHLFDLEAVVFLYVSKGWHPHAGKHPQLPSAFGGGHIYGPLKEFVIHRDHRVLLKLRAAREAIAEAQKQASLGMPLAALPDRLASCKNETSSRARACATCDACFTPGVGT